MDINTNAIVEGLNNVTKLAANMTAPKKEETKMDSKSSCGGNNINIKLGDDEKKEPQKIVEEHIHEFPENRAMTDAECNLALKRADMEYRLKEERLRQDIINEEREYKMKQDKAERAAKRGKIRDIIGGICAVLGIGAVGYGVYKYYTTPVQPAPVNAIPVTGTVDNDPVQE